MIDQADQTYLEELVDNGGTCNHGRDCSECPIKPRLSDTSCMKPDCARIARELLSKLRMSMDVIVPQNKPSELNILDIL
jgi:hypothetical protein